MAEPIGQDSSLLALTTFAFQSSTALYETIQSKVRSKRVRDLNEELEALSNILGALTKTVSATTDVKLSALRRPLLRCGIACNEFEMEILGYLSQSDGSQTSIRGWAKLRYMGDDVDGFRQRLAGYKSTFSIALADANLRKSSVTAERLEIWRNDIKNATSDIEAHLQSIDEKLQVISEQTITESGSDATELQHIKDERMNTGKCLQICAQVSDHINQLTLRQSSSSLRPMDLDSVPGRITSVALQECKDSLVLLGARLEKHTKVLIDRMETRSETPMSSEEIFGDLARLRELWETVLLCMDIIPITTAKFGSRSMLGQMSNATLTQALQDSSHNTIKNVRDVIPDNSKDEYKVDDNLTSQTVEQIEGEQRRSSNAQKQFENRYGVGYKLISQTEEQIQFENRYGVGYKLISQTEEQIQFENRYGVGYKLICQTEEQIESGQRRGSNEQEELSMREEVPDEASDDAASTYSTIFSEFSTTSASSYASRSITLTAAIDEVVILFLEDEVVQRLFSSALAKEAKEERHKVLKGITDLLNWLGRRLTNASGSQIEKELGKLFSSPRRNYTISLKISNEIEFNNSDGEKREQMKKLRNQEISLEHLEKYLEKQAGSSALNVFSELEHDISKEEETGGPDYEEEEDGEADGSQSMTSNIEAAKKFLKSNDAFSRFKEELEDFAEPFKSGPIWNKMLWDGDERVRFELSHTMSRLTNMDKLKLTAEETFRMPILWWPLKQPRKYLPSSKVRIIWVCGCGHETFVDVPCTEAQKYRRRCTTQLEAKSNNSPFLPTTNTPPSNSNLIQGWRSSSLSFIGKISGSFSGRFSKSNETPQARPVCNSNITNAADQTTPLKYIHWCVDTAMRGTLLQDICLEKIEGKNFIDELRSSYRKLRGWRWYLSMTTCTEIRLIKLIRVYQDEDVVACTWKEDVLPKEQTEYKYHLNPPGAEKETHILRAEKALIDYYHGHDRCPSVDQINELMFGVPHRFTGDKLQMKPGYGIYARQGWTLYKFLIFVLISQGCALAFVAGWLWHHPGDLQNAFTPAFYSLGFIAVLVAIPDRFFP